MAPTVTGDRPRSVIAETAASTDELLLLTPSQTIIADAVNVLLGHDLSKETQLISREHVLETVLDEFVLASRIADLQAADKLALRGTDQTLGNSLLIGEDTITAVIDGPEQCVGLSDGSQAAIENVRKRHQQYWNTATPAEPRTPPLSKLDETLRGRVGPAVAEDFTEIVTAVTPGDHDHSSLSGVAISLLAAANNEVLLYDLNRWGEDVGLASKATFSRSKSRLEDAGLVVTEKVPIDVGRPRLRLCRPPEAPSDPVAFADHARDRLA